MPAGSTGCRFLSSCPFLGLVVVSSTGARMIQRSGRPCVGKVLVLLLAGVILGLTAVVIRDQLEHLSGAVPASPSCPVCAYAQALHAGVAVCIALLWVVLRVGLSAPEKLILLAVDFHPRAPSRAPPAPVRG